MYRHWYLIHIRNVTHFIKWELISIWPHIFSASFFNIIVLHKKVSFLYLWENYLILLLPLFSNIFVTFCHMLLYLKISFLLSLCSVAVLMLSESLCPLKPNSCLPYNITTLITGFNETQFFKTFSPLVLSSLLIMSSH